MPYKTINNHQFYFEATGSGTPILFIHGLGSSTRDWEMQVPYFSKNFKAMTIDLRGHGQTKDIEGEYSVKLFASDIADLLKSEEQPAHIVGISMGGMIAFQLAVDYPSLVKSLVIINSSAEVSMEDKKTRKAIRMRKLIPRLMGMKMMGKVIGKRLFPKEPQSELRKTIANRWAENSIKNYIKSVNAIAGWTIKTKLVNITCPTLVIGSEYDYSSGESKKEYTDLIPNGKLQFIRDSGHAVPIEKPAELNEMINRFLTEC